jgi:hypothetical protein
MQMSRRTGGRSNALSSSESICLIEKSAGVSNEKGREWGWGWGAGGICLTRPSAAQTNAS